MSSSGCQAPACFNGRFSSLAITRLNASDGSVLKQWGSQGFDNCQFINPAAAVDSVGNVLVSMMGCAWHEGTNDSATTGCPLHERAFKAGVGFMLRVLVS